MSAAAAAAAAAAVSSNNRSSYNRSNQEPNHRWTPFYQPSAQPVISRYESQKRNDWVAFRQYLRRHRPELSLFRCSGVDVAQFLDDQFGNTKIHIENCRFLENAADLPSQSPCSCPIGQSWSSLDGMVGRLRVAFEENGGRPEMNPFGAHVVRLYLSQVRDAQAKARGKAYG